MCGWRVCVSCPYLLLSCPPDTHIPVHSETKRDKKMWVQQSSQMPFLPSFFPWANIMHPIETLSTREKEGGLPEKMTVKIAETRDCFWRSVRWTGSSGRTTAWVGCSVLVSIVSCCCITRDGRRKGKGYREWSEVGWRRGAKVERREEEVEGWSGNEGQGIKKEGVLGRIYMYRMWKVKRGRGGAGVEKLANGQVQPGAARSTCQRIQRGDEWIQKGAKITFSSFQLLNTPKDMALLYFTCHTSQTPFCSYSSSTFSFLYSFLLHPQVSSILRCSRSL